MDLGLEVAVLGTGSRNSRRQRHGHLSEMMGQKLSDMLSEPEEVG